MALVELSARVWSNFTVTAGSPYPAALIDRWQNIHDSLVAAGLVQTADTGQVADFNALGNAPALAGSLQTVGYRIYRFDDTAQATRPIFVRMDYGHYSGSATSPRMLATRVTVGGGTDGAGNVTNVIQSVLDQRWTTTTSITTNVPAFFGTGVDKTALVFGLYNDGNQGFPFIIERFRNADGSVNPDRVALQINGGSSAMSALITAKWDTGLWVKTTDTVNNVSDPILAQYGPPKAIGSGSGAAISLVAESKVGCSVPAPFTYKMWPGLLSHVHYAQADLAAGITFSIDRFGVSRSYKSLGQLARGVPDVGGGTGRFAVYAGA
jgi:hypothetical protein